MADKKLKTHYYHIKFFEREFKKLLKSGQTFTLVKTTYSRKVQTAQYNVFFNQEGSHNRKVLYLINKVRSEARQWLKEGGEIRKTPIDFFNLLNTPSDEIMVKLDIRSAYWMYALKNGIITKETNDKLIKTFENQPVKKFKEARTKILGSLATRKETQVYSHGKAHGDTVLHQEPTRDLYIEICRGVDDLMKLCSSEIEGCVYYYFDCMFVSRKFKKDAVQFFKTKGYDVSVEETSLDFFRIGDIGYLLSTCDDKMYLTRRENKHLIEHLI